MTEILAVPPNYRDPNWENHFFDHLLKEDLKLIKDQPIAGPDGMAYMLVETGGDEPAIHLLEWLKEKGIGLVVNPKDPYPDYVFSWGMIWNYFKNGRFILPMDQSQVGEFVIEEGQEIYSEEPSDEFLPADVRAILKDFLGQQGVKQPRVLTIYVKGQIQADLCFSLESLGQPKEEEHDGICEALSWFLPPHYSLVLMEEQGLPFIDL